MTMPPRPVFENAPGHIIRERKNHWVLYWQARSDIAKAGYRPVAFPLWRGAEPTDAERALISEQCTTLQADMMRWSYDQMRAPDPSAFYDGTIRSLVRCYMNDPDSKFAKGRYHTRMYYTSLCKRVVDDHGDKLVSELDTRQMLRWHDAWGSNGRVAMAHSLMAMTRMLFSFGMTLLKCKDCATMVTMLGEQRFRMAQPRTSILTAEMAEKIIAEAHRRGLHSIALAQAIQFDGMLRQKDVIGEWVPNSEPGLSEVFDGNDPATRKKWLRGIRWNEIDANLVLEHITSKRQKKVTIRLGDAPMVVKEFARLGTLPSSGPVIVYEVTGRPYTAAHYREIWREIATACGIPKTVRSMDSRAGAITEATEAGAELESIKHAATHSDIAMTQRYARAGEEKAANVLRLRAEHRNKRGT
jgi:hypothetical protein